MYLFFALSNKRLNMIRMTRRRDENDDRILTQQSDERGNYEGSICQLILSSCDEIFRNFNQKDFIVYVGLESLRNSIVSLIRMIEYGPEKKIAKTKYLFLIISFIYENELTKKVIKDI
jgi:hypothetical protein